MQINLNRLSYSELKEELSFAEHQLAKNHTWALVFSYPGMPMYITKDEALTKAARFMHDNQYVEGFLPTDKFIDMLKAELQKD